MFEFKLKFNFYAIALSKVDLKRNVRATYAAKVHHGGPVKTLMFPNQAVPILQACPPSASKAFCSGLSNSLSLAHKAVPKCLPEFGKGGNSFLQNVRQERKIWTQAEKEETISYSF